MSGPAYLRPQSLEEALAFLSAHGKETTIIAGGTDVTVDMRSGELAPGYLLDVSRLKALKAIDAGEKELSIGAAVTMTEIQSSDIIGRLAPALRICMGSFASRQVRNVATIGGNVAHCSPCGDTVPPLVIHEAQAELAGKNGVRRIPVENIATGPYVCSLPGDELILRFILKPAKGGWADFQKIGRRKQLAIARMSLAGMIHKDDAGNIVFARVALGACTPKGQRMRGVEDYLTGKRPTEDILWRAGRIMSENMIEITGRRSSTVYKEPAAQGLFMRMFRQVVEK